MVPRLMRKGALLHLVVRPHVRCYNSARNVLEIMEGMDATQRTALQDQWALRWKQRVALLVSYVGTRYRGIQLDAQHCDSIEEHLRTALYLSGCIRDSNATSLQRIGWNRSSRTDKGVHCAGAIVTAKLLIPSALQCTFLRSLWTNDVLIAYSSTP